MPRHGAPCDSATPLMSDVALIGVDALAQRGMALAGPLQSVIRQFQQIREGRIGEREGGGVRHRRRHVGHAIVQHAIDEVDRLGVRGGVRGFEAAALIDGDIHHHRAALHVGDHLAPHQPGRRRAGNQHRADHQVGRLQILADGPRVGSQRDHLAVEDVVEFAQAVEAAVDDGDVRAHADRHLGRVGAHDAAAQDDDIAGATPGTPPSRMPRPPLGASRYCAPTCTLMRPATSLIGVSSGSEPSRLADGLVGDAVDFGVEQLVGEFGQRRQVQIGEQDQTGAEEAVLGRLRFFDFDDQIGALPDLRRAVDDGAPASQYSRSVSELPSPA